MNQPRVYLRARAVLDKRSAGIRIRSVRVRQRTLYCCSVITPSTDGPRVSPTITTPLTRTTTHLQLTVDKHFSQGLQFSANYAWQRALNDGGDYQEIDRAVDYGRYDDLPRATAHALPATTNCPSAETACSRMERLRGSITSLGVSTEHISQPRRRTSLYPKLR